MYRNHADSLLRIGFVVFLGRLNEYISSYQGMVPRQILWVQQTYIYLQKTFPEWEDEPLANAHGNNRDIAFLNAVHDKYDQTSNWFKERIHHQSFTYEDLVTTHISHAVYFWGESTENIRLKNARYDPSWMRDWAAEGAHLYWDYLPSITKKMMDRYPASSEENVHEAWITMMFRAFCWWRCHWMDLSETEENSGIPKMRLPSRYYESKFPVYIG